MIIRTIITRFTFEYYHHWSEAPEHQAYLRDLHRHMMHVEAEVEVVHGDRNIEFIQLRRALATYVDNLQQFGLSRAEGTSSYALESAFVAYTASCEMIAEMLALWILERHGADRFVTVRVFEDNENGGAYHSDASTEGPRGDYVYEIHQAPVEEREGPFRDVFVEEEVE